jgi:hypothetical protein
MIGLIFNEFLDFADSQRPGRGRTMLGIVGRATATRYEPYECYDYEELVTLARIVARGEEVSAGEILRRFGIRLFDRLTTRYPALRSHGEDALTFLQATAAMHEGAGLHTSELLSVRCRELEPGVLEVRYSSIHDQADLTEGMILGCIAHCGGGVELERQDMPGAPGRAARFVLTATASQPRRRAG